MTTDPNALQVVPAPRLPTSIRLALLGGGSIANTVAKSVRDGKLAGVEIVGVVSASSPPSERVRATARHVDARVGTLDDILALDPDWVLEAAGAEAVRQHLPRLVASRAGLIIMSIGAVLDPNVWALVAAKRAAGGKVLLPSGAIGGLDAVSALNALGDLQSVSITTTKAPAGLATAPYLVERGMGLSVSEPQVVFMGSARDAVRGFPSNVNVAAALSLAGIGPDLTTVRVVSDPSCTRTNHTIQAEGSSGRLYVEVESSPNPMNPGSSYLAALSAVDAVRRVVG
jgi:aspartate dehydrogenase